MTTREILRLAAQGTLLGASAYFKPTAPEAQLGVSAGVVAAVNRRSAEMLIAIEGRLDDTVWVAPADLAEVASDGELALTAAYMYPAARETLKFNLAGLDIDVHPRAEDAAA